MVDLLLRHETFLTHGDERLEDAGLLLFAQCRPDPAGLDLIEVNVLLEDWWDNWWLKRHRLALLRWHESYTRTHRVIVGELRLKWEGGRGSSDHIPDWWR